MVVVRCWQFCKIIFNLPFVCVTLLFHQVVKWKKRGKPSRRSKRSKGTRWPRWCIVRVYLMIPQMTIRQVNIFTNLFYNGESEWEEFFGKMWNSWTEWTLLVLLLSPLDRRRDRNRRRSRSYSRSRSRRRSRSRSHDRKSRRGDKKYRRRSRSRSRSKSGSRSRSTSQADKKAPIKTSDIKSWDDFVEAGFQLDRYRRVKFNENKNSSMSEIEIRKKEGSKHGRYRERRSTWVNFWILCWVILRPSYLSFFLLIL